MPTGSPQTTSPIAPDGQFKERPFAPLSGWLLLPVTLGLAALAVGSVVTAVRRGEPPVALLALPAGVLFFLSLVGYFVVGPNDSRTLVLFGHYRGTVRKIGFHWTNPFTFKRTVPR
jgi:vacuolar-type H+-ATPase subunit I/STV1